MKKLLVIFLLLQMLAVNAQPVLKQLDKENFLNYYNSLLILSDVDNPLQPDKVRKLISENVNSGENKFTTYRFENTEMQGQWYKDFVFFKILQPTSYYKESRKALYDVVNRIYLAHPRNYETSTYFVTQVYNELTNNKQDYFYYQHLKDDLPLIFTNAAFKKKAKKAKKFFLDYIIDEETEETYLQLEQDANPIEKTLKIFAFENLDFINDDVPDININKDAQYFLFQREYKLGQRYNTVIFPVDVPIEQYNHNYNNGKNKMIVYKLESIGSNTLEFVKDESGILKADTPYIIKSQNEDNTTNQEYLSEYYLTDKPVDHFDINITKTVKQENDVQIIAQYSQNLQFTNSSLNNDSDVYIVSDNKLYNCQNIENTSINRFRWYVKRPTTARATPMTMIFDGTADIECIEQKQEPDNNIYDISGRKCGKASNLNSLEKGYYIVNGKVRLIGD